MVHVSSEMLDEKLDLLMYEKFAEKAYDTSEALSTEDRIVLKNMKNQLKILANVLKLDYVLKRNQSSCLLIMWELLID